MNMCIKLAIIFRPIYVGKYYTHKKADHKTKMTYTATMADKSVFRPIQT